MTHGIIPVHKRVNLAKGKRGQKGAGGASTGGLLCLHTCPTSSAASQMLPQRPLVPEPVQRTDDKVSGSGRMELCSTCFHCDTDHFPQGWWDGRRNKYMFQLPKIPS